MSREPESDIDKNIFNTSFFADRSGKVDWLNGHSNNRENINTYFGFIKDIDTVVVGWNTYHQVATELSPDEWIYHELTTYVITHRVLPSTENIKFVKDDPYSIIEQLKQEEGKAI